MQPVDKTAEMILNELRSGKIPASVDGLSYYDIRPDLVSTNGPEYENFELIKTCLQIMRNDPTQSELGKQFLSELYFRIAKPAFHKDKNPTAETPLHWAAATGQVDEFSLLTLGQSNAFDKKGRTPMDWAMEYRQLEVVQKLIDLDVKPSEKSLPAVMRMLCARGDIERAQKILGSKITPIDWAVQNHHHDIVQQLIAHKVQPSEESLPALIEWVADEGDLKLAKDILASGVTPSLDSLHVLMDAACLSGDIELARYVLNTCPSHEDKVTLLNPGANYQGSRYLLQACQGDHTDLALLLLPHVNVPMTPKGASSLDAAIAKGNPILVKAILERELAMRDENAISLTLNSPGYSPLAAAVRIGNSDVVKILVEYGADPLSVMSLAREQGNQEILNFLGPLETDEHDFQECRELIRSIRRDFLLHKESVLPRTKLKEKLVSAALTILERLNNDDQRGKLTIARLLTKPIAVSELGLDPKEAETYNAYLCEVRGSPVPLANPLTTLQHILEFHRRPAVANKRGDTFFQKPASAQHVLREFEPTAIKSEALKFITGVIEHLTNQRDFAGTPAKARDMKARREAKIRDLSTLKLKLESSNIHSLKDLCELTYEDDAGVQKNLLFVLNTHRDADKQGKKDTKSYQAFAKLFRLEQHDEINVQELKVGVDSRNDLNPDDFEMM